MFAYIELPNHDCPLNLLSIYAQSMDAERFISLGVFYCFLLSAFFIFFIREISCFLWWHNFSRQFTQEILAFVFSEKRSGCIFNVISQRNKSASDSASKLHVYKFGIKTNGVNIMAKSQLKNNHLP